MQRDAKRPRLDEEEEIPAFADGLFDTETSLTEQIAKSEPYKHGIIQPLFNDDLLKNARNEIESQLHFTKKETDIYKVFQTGDLANLTNLDAESLSKIPSLAKLRDALYSKSFRDFLSKVTRSGPLSGIKKDLSINVYEQGCHLLNHDDVIGTRRISYILYLVEDPWLPKWGGALRLFPTLKENIPCTDWSKSIPPAWNQLAFFTVQPGQSFHDVEEVYVDKPRLSISGWFHVPQEGEEGYNENGSTEGISSLEQLQFVDPEFDFPKRMFTELNGNIKIDLSDEDRTYLSKFLDSRLLETSFIKQLSEEFLEDSSIMVKPFLNDEYAQHLKQIIDEEDLNDPPTTSETIKRPWDIARPPHKARYMYLECGDLESSDETVVCLQELLDMFKSSQFGRFLRLVSSMTPRSGYALARRFRPGYDFTLATKLPDQEPLLEGILDFTPSRGWGNGELGGYDLCMAEDQEAELDPAVYRTTAEEDEDDSVLFNHQVSFNSFSLIVRDEGVLRFIKYVSRNAPGSRWDINFEWRIEEEENEDNDEQNHQ